ncbi:MAG: alpha/beta fold hydrolase [Dehalococcoidia bacterium]
MLHAFPLDSDMWDHQVEALSQTAPVVAPDLPGFGQSAMLDPDGWMDAAADVADASLGGTGIDRVVVCGLSMGGYVALAYLRRHRDKVAGLILANTRADGDDEAAQERRRGLAERLRSEGNFLADSPPPLLSDGASPELRERVSTIIRRQAPEAIARASLAMAGRADSRGDLAGIDVPTLVITSSADALISPDLSKQIADAIPGARLEMIEGAGHLSNLEAPEEFDRLVSEFVSTIGS